VSTELGISLVSIALAIGGFLYSRIDRTADERREIRMLIDAIAAELHRHQLEYERALRAFITRAEFERFEDSLRGVNGMLANLMEMERRPQR
jgi:hypothetical protein